MTTSTTAPASTGPAVTRRRELGETSARSLLMTVLGEYVLPRGEPVWTSALVRALGLLGTEEKTARQALARSCAEGWLASQRLGRQARWQLTGPGRRLLSDGASRIYSFGHQDRPWPGQWLVLLVSVPESRRELRHRLRTRLQWAGFGTPSPGVWLSPHTGTEAQARQILADLGLAAASVSLLASNGSIGTQAGLARQAWDLNAVAARYSDFIDTFAGAWPDGPDGPDTPDSPGGPGGQGDSQLFTAATRLVHEWRRFPFLDPELPPELLPPGWIGAAAARLFAERHGEWHGGAQRYWDCLTGHTR
jgi:phenylacetic acid degradation operon negative regulatory protein